MSHEDRHPARRHQRLPLRQPRATPRAHEILMCIQQRQDHQGREAPAAHRPTPTTSRSPAEMDAPFSDCPRRWRTRPRIAEQCNVELELGKTVPAALQGARGLRRSTATSRELAARGPRARASPSSPRAGSTFDPDAVPRARSSSSSASSRRWASRATS